MAKLRDSHLGIGPNRVSHDGERWHIKPPLNYSVSASLPANTALIDRRAAARMEHASNEGQLLKRAVSLTSPEVQAQVSTAVARASAVPVRSFFSSDVGTEVEAAPPLLPPPSVVELALEPVDLRQVVNVKVVRPQTTQSMVAAAFARQPAMSARQFGATMAELTVASREALSSIHIYQVDMRDVPSALRSLSAVPDGDLPALEEAIRLRRSLESTQLMDMEAANQAHLDAAAVVVAPSQPTVTNWIKADCAIAESVARFNNDKADGPKNYAWLCTDKGGKADFKQQNVGEFHWDEESGLVETTLLTCLETGGNAEDNKSSFDHAMSISGLGTPLGHTSDSAGDVLSGLLALMSVQLPSYVAIGCWLHILNLMISGPFCSTYGAAEWGVASLLRLVFMVHYLLEYAIDAFKQAATAAGHAEWGVLPQRGEVGRWWSVFRAIGDIYNDPDRLEFLVTFFAQYYDKCQSPTYKPLFKTVGEWLASEKIKEEAMMLSCFYKTFWAPHFEWFNGRPRWLVAKGDIPTKNNITGLRLGELPKHLILMFRHLCDLRCGSGSPRAADTAVEWAPWRAALARLAPDLRETAQVQFARFLDGAEAVLQKHGGRVLVEFPDAALGDSDATCDGTNTISYEVMRRLLHLYDGGDDAGHYVEIDSEKAVDVEGEQVNLKELVHDICQFSTGGGLSSRSLFFTDDSKVALIRAFVATGEVSAELGLEIRRVIRPALVTSLAAEHYVHEANNQQQLQCSKRSEALVHAVVVKRVNEVLKDKMDAWDKWQKSSAQGATVNMKRGVSLSFRRPGQPVPRTAAGTINKGMTYMQISASRNRAQSYVPGIVAYAKAEAALRAADGTDHDAHIAWRKAKKAKKTNDNKKKSNPTTAAALSAVGSSIIPEKAQSLLDNDNKDTLDLSAKNGKTELIEELKARNADSYPKVQSGPNQGNPTGAVNIPMLTSLLKAANDDRNIVVRKAAGASAPAVPEWRR